MDRESFINKYSRFDTTDIAERIAEEINKYIAFNGIEYLEGREIHGRHTGYLNISSGGFRGVYDFLCPVLCLCRLDRNGIVSADIKKIEKHLDIWRADLRGISDEDLEFVNDGDFDDDDGLYAFKSAAYNAELDGFMKLDSPSIEEIVKHELSVDAIWNLSSENNLNSVEEETPDSADHPDEDENTADSTFHREYDEYGYPIYTDEEIEIYEQATDDMLEKSDSFLERCREIFYNEGKEALHEYLNELEDYSGKHKSDCDRYDDPMYFPDYEIRGIRERFNVWDEEKERLRREKLRAEMQEEDYWGSFILGGGDDLSGPTLDQNEMDDFEEIQGELSFAEFVSLVRRGEFGDLPEDYDGLAESDDPGYYED